MLIQYLKYSIKLQSTSTKINTSQQFSKLSNKQRQVCPLPWLESRVRKSSDEIQSQEIDDNSCFLLTLSSSCKLSKSKSKNYH